MKTCVFKINILSISILLTSCSLLQTSHYHTAPTSLARASEYNVQLGLAYLQKGDHVRAKEKLLRAQNQAPYSATAKGAMGYFLNHIGERHQAEGFYLKAVALAPKSGAVHNNYGSFLCQHGRYIEAESHFLKATQDPNYLNTANAWENAGLCALRLPNISKACYFFHKTLTQDPKRATTWLILAQLYYQTKNYPKANYCLEQYYILDTSPLKKAHLLKAQLASKLC